MRKTLTILLSILSLSIIAQVPQGVGYQGVATDANGIELVNQSISIRASVLSGSATGTIEWEETHATSTDTFGLFTLTIGQGTNTTNGAQTSFADISWGTNTHFLKIEMDVTGGSNYSFMGTNQMMSVPYALYAENANINYDSISNLLSNDSTFITNVGGGMGGGGCDIEYPDGLNGIAITSSVTQSNHYIVPNGKRLYITSWKNWEPIIQGSMVNVNYDQPLILNSGETLSTTDPQDPSQFNGFLVDENPGVIAITSSVAQSNHYIVPNGKRLYIMSWRDNYPFIQGLQVSYYDQPLILNSGESLSNSHVNPSNFNGYLVDENYFAGCGGGGGSSSTTTINYDSLANIISMDSTFITTIGSGIGGGGCDFDYPDGFDNMQVIHHSFTTSPYVVPTGKNLYIRQFFDDSPGQITVNGETVYHAGGFTNSQPNLIFSEGDILDALSGNPYFYGFIVDKEVDALQHLFSVQNPYTVPTGKNLFVRLLANNQSSNIFKVNGQTLTNTDFNPLLILNPDDEIEVFGNNTINQIIYGYLADENYFAGCGGGGGSSSSSSSSNTSSANPAIGVSSVVDLNDFDNEYDMFNAQLSGNFDHTEMDIHVDQDNNTYIIGQYNAHSGNNCAIAGIPLVYSVSTSAHSIFIAKYDTSGNLVDVHSEQSGIAGLEYFYSASTIDNYGNIFITGKHPISNEVFIRKYNSNALTLLSNTQSTNGISGSNKGTDIISDNNGGAYVCGQYANSITFGGYTLQNDIGNNPNGFVLHINNNNSISWAHYIGDLNVAGHDEVQSLALDLNNNLLVTGQLDYVLSGINTRYKTFIKKYNASSGVLNTTKESAAMGDTYDEYSVRIMTNSNNDIYLFTSHDVNLAGNYYVFNNIPLHFINWYSQILYKFDSSFNNLDAINFGTTIANSCKQIEILSNNDIILRTTNVHPLDFVIDNTVYTQDNGQMGNLTHLNSNNNFIKFHTLGSELGTTWSIGLSSNNNQISILYKRSSVFINNGSTHLPGYYVVREQY